MKKEPWVDITDVLTKEGRDKLQTGQVLRFDKADLKIVRKTKDKVWAKKSYLYLPEEVEVTDKVE